MKTLEQRIARAERVLKMFARAGRKYRTEFREKVNILIAMQMKDNQEWRARKREMDEKIEILINSQIFTEEQRKDAYERIKETDEQLKNTDQRVEALNTEISAALDRLAASQAKTDEALERFLDGRSEDGNGKSSN